MRKWSSVNDNDMILERRVLDKSETEGAGLDWRIVLLLWCRAVDRLDNRVYQVPKIPNVENEIMIGVGCGCQPIGVLRKASFTTFLCPHCNVTVGGFAGNCVFSALYKM
jgi:hypothetical protein